MPNRHFFAFLLAMTCLLTSNMVFSEEPSEGAEAVVELESAEYVEITPAIVTNYVSETLRYVKADVALKVRGLNAKRAVSYHIPRIKHVLIAMLSRQSQESVSSAEGKLALKDLALEEINAALSAEDSTALVEEVLFTGFLVE